jgi:hypothetical protein
MSKNYASSENVAHVFVTDRFVVASGSQFLIAGLRRRARGLGLAAPKAAAHASQALIRAAHLGLAVRLEHARRRQLQVRPQGLAEDWPALHHREKERRAASLWV